MTREKLIKKFVAGKSILDIGSVGQTSKYNLWDLYPTFGIKKLTGIDIDLITEENQSLFGDQSIVESADIVCGNMETYKFDNKFDIVVAGDVIEHVSNQGLFLDNIFRHLNKNGLLIITTPNAKWPTVFLKPNPTHAIWHDKYTISRILSMHNFTIKEFHYYRGNKKRYVFPLNILAWRQGMLVLCEKKESNS